MSIQSLLCLLLVVLVVYTVKAKIPRYSLENAVQKTMKIQGIRQEQSRQRIENDRPSNDGPDDDLLHFHGQRSRSREKSNAANQILDAAQNLLDQGFTIEEVTSDITAAEIREILLANGLYEQPQNFACNPLNPYRTVDGSCNNLDHPEWGKSFRPQRRVLTPAYEKGSVGRPRATGINGTPLPNPRTVSNVVHSNTNGVTINSTIITLNTFQMGQFLDHDIISTPFIRGMNDIPLSISCCGPNDIDRPDCIPIKIPPGDPYFPDGTCLSVTRSVAANASDVLGYRQQQNEVTSYIDGSNVYGSTDEQLLALRDGEYMKTSNKCNLPRNPNGRCVLNNNFEFCHLAGEPRVNTNPSLTSFHTIFMNEHNRIVDALSRVNPMWDANRLFQEARKINIAQIQHIVYNGFLNAFMSQADMTKYKLHSLKCGYSTAYDKKRDASVSNGFGIAFRMGHTWIPTYHDLYTDLHKRQSGRETGPFDIVQTFNNPHLIFLNQRTGSEGLLKWLISEANPATDRIVEDSVRNRLFQNFTTNASLDLPALNINRGRDHGVPPYGKYRESCGLSALYKQWQSLVDHDQTNIALLRKVYNDPRDIDLFTGVLTERGVAGSDLGPTLGCILGREFQNLKEGDSYWYERPEPQGFPIEQLDEIRKTSLSAVLCAHLNLKQIQTDAFKLPGIRNPMISCSNLPSMDLTKWKSAPSTI